MYQIQFKRFEDMWKPMPFDEFETFHSAVAKARQAQELAYAGFIYRVIRTEAVVWTPACDRKSERTV